MLAIWLNFPNNAPVIACTITLLLLALGAIFIGCTKRKSFLQRRPAPRRTQQLTWRLFITLESGMDLYLLTPPALRTAIEKEFQVSLSGSRLVLARERDRYCATISLQTTTPSFRNERTFTLEIDSGTGEKLSASITPDDQFLRMTTLYDGTVEDNNAVDLIVVPGLSSHAFGSFKSPLAAGENWLRDYLPQSLPNIRVLVYGYDSRLLQYEGKESILDFAKGLLESIHSHRGDPITSRRPVIFLGHSLGGLLIKEALAIAMDETSRAPEDEQLSRACYGLIFFGVPNLGLRHEQLLTTVIGRSPSERLIRDLIVDQESEPSPLLRTLADKFVRCCKAQDFQIISFYETDLSYTVQHVKGEWKRSGPKKLMVTQESATNIDGRSNPRIQIPLNADHSGLVKFKGIHDPNYTDTVRRHIEQMVRAAPTIIDARFTRMHELLPIQVNKLRSLRIGSLHEVRHTKINEACPDTLYWFLDKEEFRSWRDSPGASSLWIHGSPGQGKSVLAKFLTKHLEDYAESLPTEKIVVISFFCYRQEDEPVDILRSLILQLIDCQELFTYLPNHYQESRSEFLAAPFAVLWDLFTTLALDSRHRRIYCILDALDECIQANNYRADLLRRCVDFFSSGQRRLKLLLTSRPGEKDVELHLHDIPSISLHARPEDLNTFVRSKIEVLSKSSSLSDQLKKQIQDTVSAQAGGTFLWANIVMEQVAGLPAPNLHEVEQVLEENPRELNELYLKLVTRLITTPIFAKILVWVAYAERALTLEELTEAINYDPAIKPYKRLSEMTRYRSTIDKELICGKLGTLLDVHRKDKSEYGGRDEDTNDYVFINHHSIKEFFHKDGKAIISNCGFIDNNGPDFYLARTCLYYLSAREVNEIPPPKILEFEALVQKARKASAALHFSNLDIFEGECEKLSDRFLFLKYASVSWYKHIKTRQHAEHEWNQIERLLDYEQSIMALWVRGHWETGMHIFRDVLFLTNGVLGFRLSDLAIELDISWLTELILAKRVQEARFTEEQIVDMATRSPVSFEYLCVCRKDIKLPDKVLIASANGPYNRNGLQMLLEHRRAEIKITEGVVEAAAAHTNDDDGPEVVELLLDQDDAKGLRITDECLKIAAKKGERKLMRLLLARKAGKVTIVDELLKVAAENHKGIEALQALLEHFGSRVKFTEEFLIVAVKGGVSMLELLFKHGRHEVRVTEAVIQAAAGSYQPSQTLKYLLEHASKDVKITESILITAGKNFDSPKLIKILLEERGRELTFTEEVLRAVLTGSNGGESLAIILDQHHAGVEITDGVLLAAINHSADRIPRALQYGWAVIDVIEVIANQIHKKIEISEAIAEVAARKLPRIQEMRSVLRMRNDGAIVTEALLKAAAENCACGKAMVQLLLHEGEDHIKVTENILVGAASNTRAGEEILEWMLHKYANQMNVTEQVLVEASLNPFQSEKLMVLLLNQRSIEVKVTETVIRTATTSWRESQEMSVLFKKQKVEFQAISTMLINQGSRGMTDYIQRDSCQRMNEASLGTIKLLLDKFEPRSGTTEDLLTSSVEDKYLLLRLLLLKEESEVPRDETSFFKLMEERGVTTEGLALCACHLLGLNFLQTACRLQQKDAAISYETLEFAASNEEEGHLIIPQIFGEEVTWLQNKSLVENIILAAAASGQVRLLHYVFERLNVEANVRSNLLATCEFLNAVKLNDEEMAIQLLASGAKPDIVNPYGRTPLWQACVLRHTSLVHRLLETGTVEIERADRWRRSVLHWAAALNHKDIVTLLLKYGADPDRKDMMGFTPLRLAQRWQASATESLLQKLEMGESSEETEEEDGEIKLDEADSKIEQWTALHIAARSGREGILTALLDKGSNVNAQTQKLLTPLHVAAQKGHDGTVEELLKRDADVKARDKRELTALHLAVYYNHGRVVKVLLDGGSDINAQSKGLLTPLHLAVRRGHVEIVRDLLGRGARADLYDEHNLTALHDAASAGYEGALEALLDGGSDPNAQEKSSMTPLHVAARTGHARIVELLLIGGADNDARDEDRWTALHFAAPNGHEGVVKALLEGGADIDAQDVTRSTPLHLTAKNGNEMIVEQLLKGGADIIARDKDYNSALHLATESGNERVMKVLLDYGADVNARDSKKSTPLHLAAGDGNEMALKLLLERGADVNAREGQQYAALHFAIKKGNEGVITALLEGGADVEAQDSDQYTALHIAADYGNQKVIKILLDGGAIVDTRDGDGYTALHFAAERGDEAAAKALLDGGADINAKTLYGQTMLHLAAADGRTEIATLALERGSDASISDDSTWTALHYAAQAGHVAILKLILARDVPIDLPNSSGWTALHLATDSGHSAVVDTLIEHGANINITTDSGQTPLICAIIKVRKDVTEALINHHADVSIVDNYGMTAKTWLKALKTNDEMFRTLCEGSEIEETLDKSRLKQTVVDLSVNLLEKQSANPAITFNRLGHCFAMLDLTEKAFFAFQQLIETTSDSQENAIHGVVCDSCSVDPIEGRRYVCEICPDIDLCLSCMDAYHKGKSLQYCMNHTFMEISALDLKSHEEETIKLWLQENIEMFSEGR